jgi:hypothetical protein
VSILEHYFASKSFDAVREAFSNALIEDWHAVRIVSKSNCGNTVSEETINSDRYQNLLTQFISLLHEHERYCWFRRDRATARTANTTAFLQKFFGQRIVERGLWPLQPPDLTPPDFFL